MVMIKFFKITSCLICFGLFILIGCQENHLFNKIGGDYSGVTFNNNIVENDTLNPLDRINIYNGGGVGVGDFNNDGLEDIYFSGNLVSNRLYLNKGNLKFKDITAISKVNGMGRWGKGVTVVDINNDGWLDIYISCSMGSDANSNQNLLYINRGNNNYDIPIFEEMAKAYGLNDFTQTTMASFFDFDKDGDLDVFLTVNEIRTNENPNLFRKPWMDSEHPSTDRLYRNDENEALGHPVFTDISKEAGITNEGFGHAAAVTDINGDGWKDIYVTNDFMPNNILYINNQDGTFSNQVKKYFKHTSSNSMGLDIMDMNNDGLQDVIELDMNPEDNYRDKTMMNGSNINIYKRFAEYNYQHEYVRNVLQLNQGTTIDKSGFEGPPIFSEIGLMSGIAETDWSWGPLAADFDNDGYKDLIITNGYPKDVTDHDFIAFRNNSYQIASKEYLLKLIPEVKIANYAYRNNGDLTFKKVTGKWGLDQPSFSNGAAFADLDNDGDLDFIVNNINEEAFIYENTIANDGNKRHLKIRLKGTPRNRNGIGSLVTIFYGDQLQVYEQNPYRGYLSTVQLNPFFGVGNIQVLDSLRVEWPGGEVQTLTNVETNTLVTLDSRGASSKVSNDKEQLLKRRLFTEISTPLGFNLRNQKINFEDFNIQKLLPRTLSNSGPGLASGDVDGNGLDDLVLGGANGERASVFLQNSEGSFEKRFLIESKDLSIDNHEDQGIALFDADGDGDLDLYIASGGYQLPANHPIYQDRLYVNDGKGNFKHIPSALPQMYSSTSCVRISDFDKDGDMDIFVGGSVEPGNYPRPEPSYLLVNEANDETIVFSKGNRVVSGGLDNIGIITDALWTDFDQDGWKDLIMVGECTTPILFKNNKGDLERVVDSNLGQMNGFWNSLVPGDFDNDGDTDYVIGNIGLNTFLTGSREHPVSMYGFDLNNDGNLTCVPTKFYRNRNGELKEYPIHGRDEIVEQMPFIKKKYLTYSSFADATIEDMIPAEIMDRSLKVQASHFESTLILNQGNGKFTYVSLPKEANFSTLNGMLAEDFDGDGNMDLVMVGNDYGMSPTNGRSDAFNGLFLRGNGKGGFKPISIAESGWYVPLDSKVLVKFRSAFGETIIATIQNSGGFKMFKTMEGQSIIPLGQNDENATITYRNGTVQIRELNNGSSYLSQSSRFLNISENVNNVILYKTDETKRNFSF